MTPEKKKVDAVTALLLSQFKGIAITKVIIKLPTGKSGEKVFDTPIKLDQLAAKFYREGAQLNIKNGVLTWKHDGIEYTPEVGTQQKKKIKGIGL